MVRFQNGEGLQQQELVHVACESFVKPMKPTKRHVMYMSTVDQLLAKACPSRTILFYRTAEDAGDAVKALRLGIASALVPYYPMAGRLCEDIDGRLAIDCNDQGVQLIQAECDLPFEELERNSFCIRPLFRQLVPMEKRETSDQLDDPFASFQVTTFKGGLTVGIAVLHSVADGYAMWSFIRAVAQACRGTPFSVYPLHSRLLLKPEVFLMNARFLDARMESKMSDAAPYNGCEDAVHEAVKPPPDQILHSKVIHFSREMLDTLKKACLSSTDPADAKKPGFFVSSYQALGAYLWKRLIMAQELEDDTCVDFRVSADVRGRMIPALTPAYFGNAVVGIPTPATAKEVMNESLGNTAARIRRSIQQGDDAYIKAALIAREKKDLGRILLSKVRVMVVRNGSGFPVYEGGDFGWGEPEAVRPPREWREGEFTWYPGKQAKSIDVIACLFDTTCANFFSSHLFPNDPLRSYLFPASN